MPEVDFDTSIRRLRWHVAADEVLRSGRRVADLLRAKYDPNQPRVPAGNPDGGQWTDTGGETGSEAGRNDPRVLSDASPEDEWIAGAQYAASRPHGHHFMPQSLFNELPFSIEARKAFEDAKTGRLHDNRHLFDESHREYNKAVRELRDQFLQRNNIRPEQMTGEQAGSLLKQIKESGDPRIRNYNLRIYLREIMHQVRRRGMRGND